MIDDNTIRSIVREVLNEISAGGNNSQLRLVTGKQVPVALSNRHVHLSSEVRDILFGPNYTFEIKKNLSQPGQYAYQETVTLLGPKGIIEKVRILGPERKETQIEVSRADSIKLGLNPPVRDSGDLKDTPGITISGPKGCVCLPRGVILAWRHIHMSPSDSERLGVKDKQLVKVRVASGPRPLVFDNVLIRVSEKYVLEMHIDLEEGNAALLKNGDYVEIV